MTSPSLITEIGLGLSPLIGRPSEVGLLPGVALNQSGGRFQDARSTPAPEGTFGLRIRARSVTATTNIREIDGRAYCKRQQGREHRARVVGRDALTRPPISAAGPPAD